MGGGTSFAKSAYAPALLLLSAISLQQGCFGAQAFFCHLQQVCISATDLHAACLIHERDAPEIHCRVYQCEQGCELSKW